MTSLTNDELRLIYSFLPLDQEPTIENINKYIQILSDNFDKEEDKIEADWDKWRRDVNYNQYNQQFDQLLLQLRRLIEEYNRGCAKMVSLHETNFKIPTNFEEIESMVINRPDHFFDISD